MLKAYHKRLFQLLTILGYIAQFSLIKKEKNALFYSCLMIKYFITLRTCYMLIAFEVICFHAEHTLKQKFDILTLMTWELNFTEKNQSRNRYNNFIFLSFDLRMV